MKGGMRMNETDLQKAFDKIRNGDREAFTLLYSDLKQPIFTIICRIVQSKETAEDIMQDVFVKLFVSPPEPSVKNTRADGAQFGDRRTSEKTEYRGY